MYKKSIFLFIVFLLVSTNYTFSQDSTVSNDGVKRKVYSAAKDNWCYIPFIIVYAEKPKPIEPLPLPFADNPIPKLENVALEPDTLYGIMPGSRGITKTHSKFNFKFIPREPGIFAIKLMAEDETRKRREDGYGDSTVVVNVVEPVFTVNKDAPPKNIFYDEGLFIRFGINGLDERREYKVIKTWNGVTDTIPGDSIKMGSDIAPEITRADIGKSLEFKVLYKNETYFYLDTENKLKESVFNYVISGDKTPKILVSGTPINDGERILFYAIYQGNSRWESMPVSDITRITVKSKSDKKDYYASKESAGDGKYYISLKPTLKVPKDGVEVEVNITSKKTVSTPTTVKIRYIKNLKKK